MAKKPRTPPPPRVQAPQRRDSKGGRDERARWILYATAALGPIALAIVLGVIFLGGDGNDSKASAKQPLAAGCTLKRFPLLARTHLSTEDQKATWNSWPPTSGPHYFQPAPWNFYTDPINPRITLHNLEHGGIVIFYGRGVSADTIEQLRSFWQDDPNGILVAPMPTPDENLTIPRPVPDYTNKVVATAWTAEPYESPKDAEGNGFLLTCPRYDEETFTAFRDIHRTKGPERFPLSALQPNQ